MTPRRPALRYHGGKWRLAPWIIQNMPPHLIYVEPFGGACSVLLRKPASYAEIYNDMDGDVVNVFRVLRDGEQAARLRSQLELTPWSRNEFFAALESSADPVERARRTIVRSFMAFGTTWRRKNSTGFRAKVYVTRRNSAGDWTTYRDEISAFTKRLITVTIEERPAIDVICHHDSADTLFYCDPPYVTSTRTSVRTPSLNDRCYSHEMTDMDHAILASTLHSVKGMVMLSGYDSELYTKMYGDWKRVEIASIADGAKKRTEFLWLNPAASIALAKKAKSPKNANRKAAPASQTPQMQESRETPQTQHQIEPADLIPAMEAN
jgi:DNA adenine methylase